MRETQIKIIKWLIVLAVLTAAGYGTCRYWLGRRQAMAESQAGGPMPMPVDKCTRRDVTEALEFTGTTEAINAVEIPARVEGFLQGIHFNEGSIVEKGQLLFTIEPETYKARRDEAQAMLKSGQAELERARLDLERIQKAVKAGAVSQQDLTSAKAAYDTAKAQVMRYQAALDKAELDLSYTRIHSPITGRIGRRLVDVGNLVGAPDHTVLTTVRQVRPIYVYFYIGEDLLQGELLKRLQGGDDVEPLSISVGLPNKNDFPYKGTINFMDNTVDTKTGTVYVRGELPNESRQLLPGMFVRVRVPIAERKDAVLVPEKAINTDLGGKYVLIVGKDNVLERRDVRLGELRGRFRVVNEGLDGSETFITGMFHIARPGMKIQPMVEEKRNTDLKDNSD